MSRAAPYWVMKERAFWEGYARSESAKTFTPHYATGPRPPRPEIPDEDRCPAITKSGERCKRRAAYKSDMCTHHVRSHGLKEWWQ